ncbi:MAG: hypothetical protein EHM47_03925 [Ignavibacteriales bacterium]|nr:MAG: hypothetical protein EHM47_03925 [Ignavibacteriales bacterium]
MFDKSKPMDLGDIFSNTFKLLGQTFSRNIVIACAFIIPAGLLMASATDSFFSEMMLFARSAEENRNKDFNPELILDLFANMGFYSFAVLIFLLGHLGALIGITKISCSSINGDRISLGEAFNKVFSITAIRCIGQLLLLFLALYTCVLAGIIIIIIGASSEIVPLTIFGVVALIAGTVLMFYLMFRWYFAFIAIVCEDNRVIESFLKSSMLVEGNWWRTFGIVLLFSVLIDFAVSIISTPIYFIAMWDFFAQYFKMMADGTINENDPAFVFNMMESFGFAIGIVILVSTLLETLIAPVFNVVYYIDLKIRKKDFPELINPVNEAGGVPSIE